MKRHLARALALGGTALAAAAAFTAAAPARTTAAPTLVREPHVSGTTAVGRTLTTSNGRWRGATSFRYQWQHCDRNGTTCTTIANATGKRYRLVPADAGVWIRSVVGACNASGCSSKESNPVGPVRARAVPANTAAPTVSGTPVVGGALSANEGSWTNAPTSYAYQWFRCDVNGANCGAIAGASFKTYAVSSDDFGATLRVSVTARNSVGASQSAQSAPTAVVGKTTQGGVAVSISAVHLPDRLVVSGVQFSPARITHAPFTARFKVTDTNGRLISGALVYVLALPYGWTSTAPEVATGPDGWATLTLRPTRGMPRRGAVVMFVRARKPGDSLLAGVSTRRLVQVSIAG
jgi:hypothetical protein